MIIKLRYNTDNKNDKTPWRLLIDGVEHLVPSVKFCGIDVNTTKDQLEGIGEKWHISCEANEIIIKNGIWQIK